MFTEYTFDRGEGCRANEYRILETVYEKRNGFSVVRETVLCKITKSHTAPSKITDALNRVYGGWIGDPYTGKPAAFDAGNNGALKL